MKPFNISELSHRLAERAEDVVARLIPGGKRINGDWVAGNVFGEPGDSFKIQLHGSHAGKWRDWASDEHGDLLDLWRISRGCSAPEAFDQVRDYLGLPKTPTTLSNRSYGPCPNRPEVQPLSETGRAVKWLMTERKLNADVIQRFKISGCAEKKAIVFPSYNPKGELVNRSYRTLGDEKKVWQEKGAAPCLFGWHGLPDSAYRDRTVVLCEGQIDAMTWGQWGIPALSIPNGSGQTWIEYEWDNLSAFETILLSFDSDAAGKENLRKTSARLGLSRCLIVKLPHKDANECLQRGMGPDEARRYIAEARPPRIERMVTADDLGDRVAHALTPREACITLPFLKGKTEYDGFYFRPGEVTLWTGPTSAGKSTMLNYLALFLISEKVPVYIASMEAKAERVIIKMMTTLLSGAPSEAQGRRLCAHYGAMIALADITSYITPDELFEQMRFCFQRYGTQHFFIDSLMRVSGLEEEYDAQGKFLNDLQGFAKGLDVHVHLVAHSRKIKEGDRATKQDVKGSSLISNNADNILSVRRNMEKKLAEEKGEKFEHLHDAELSVEKQRETGWEGSVRLRFDRITGTFEKCL